MDRRAGGVPGKDAAPKAGTSPVEAEDAARGAIRPARHDVDLSARPRRALGIDLGSKRIGVAVSDRGGVLASPLTTVERTRDTPAVHRRLRELVVDEEVEVVVVGLPRSLDGSVGAAAEAALAEASELADVLGVPVVTHDERLTTVTAHQQLRAAGVDGRRRRQIVDQQAAVVLLQSWLDANRPKDPPTP